VGEPVRNYIMCAYALVNGVAVAFAAYGSGLPKTMGCVLVAASMTMAGIPALGLVFSKVP
jgi:hypothetical protein